MKASRWILTPIIVSFIPTFAYGDWTEPVNLGPMLGSESSDGGPALSENGEVLFFHSNRPGGSGGNDLWVSLWDGEAWDLPLNLGAGVNTEYEEVDPCISKSGDTLYFSSDRPGGEGGYDIWMSVFEGGQWDTPVNMGAIINSASAEIGPEIARDGEKIFFHSNRAGGYGGMDIWVSLRVAGEWRNPLNLGNKVNSASHEQNPALDPAVSVLYFASDRSGGYGGFDLYAAFIEGISFGEAFNLGWQVNSSSREGGPAISSRGGALYFSSQMEGGLGENDLWMASYVPGIVTERWVARYNGPENGWDNAHDIAIDAVGNVFVTGASMGVGSTDYATLKYDSDGNEVWVARYNGTGNGGDVAYSIALDHNNNVYVTGKSYGSGGSTDFATIKYDANGNELWVKRYNGPGNGVDVAYSIVIDDDGSVYVTGESFGSGGSDEDMATIKYDGNGNLGWVSRYNGPGGGRDAAYAIALDTDGSVCVTGECYGGADSEADYATIKYDADGTQVWVSRYDGPGNGGDVANGVAVSADGNVHVTGKSTGSGTYTDYATVKYDSEGNEVWVERYDGSRSYYDVASAVAVDSEGKVYVTGASYETGTLIDYGTIKYDEDGTKIWFSRYDGPGDYHDIAYAIEVDGRGCAYVTGASYGSGGSDEDYATVKYDQNGNQVWVSRYYGPANSEDVASTIAVGRDGSVYVTGHSYESGEVSDFATIRYRQNPPADIRPAE